MEIHELNDYSGSLGASDYLAIDDGNDTGKVSVKKIIDNAVEEALEQLPPSVFYGTSSTSPATATKVVDCSDFSELFSGAVIAVKFNYAQTSTSTIYLNVNDTGAKQVYGIPRATTATTRLDGAWEANEVKFFVYDGTYWRIVDQNIITSTQLSNLQSILGVYGLANALNAIITPFGKELWSGEWTSGTKTITNGSKYCAYIIVVNGIPCIAARDGNQIRGFNVATTTTQTQYAKAVQITTNGDSWTLDSARQLNHIVSGNHSAGIDMSVTKIIGLVPSWGE